MCQVYIMNKQLQVLPLSYSIPEELIRDIYKDKLYDMAPLIPGKADTYIYNTQESYYDMYNRSKYGLTYKKGGWDCLRHYEMLASGCIPLFKDLEKCPINTMKTFPKKKINEFTNKYSCLDKDENLDDDYVKDMSDYLTKYTKKYLTCRANALYFIGQLGLVKSITTIKILMLSGASGHRNINYSRELLSIGLRRILGNRFIEYPKLNVLYKGCKNKYKYIGKGFTYGERLDDIKLDRSDIENRITSKEFDVIIYGKVGKKYLEIDPVENLSYWKEVNSVYDKNSIVFIYGGDKMRTVNDDDIKYHCTYGKCFIRELQ